MSKQSEQAPRWPSRGARGFLAGIVVGGGFALATVSPAEDAQQHDAVAAVLYAISQLAVDTEQNAKRIVELSDRLERLEQQIKDQARTSP